MLSQSQRQELTKALTETYFHGWKPEFFHTAAFQKDLDDHVFKRYEECQAHLVPWIKRVFPLTEAVMIEIGCGTGSSTAALAPLVKHVHGYDIAEASVRAAKRRFEILGLSHLATFHCLPPDQILAAVVANSPVCARDAEGCEVRCVDAVLIYAVLEHQTIAERLLTLRTCWQLLRPGGILIVADTPNRLTYFDAHTSSLPFFHMLPDEIAVPYASRSPRAGLRESIAGAAMRGDIAATETLARWGRGVSYHEFELALGDLSNLVVADGFAPEMSSWLGWSEEEEILHNYWKHKGIAVPVGFCRRTVDVILRKPE